MRFCVLDDEGLVIRRFWSLPEAQHFCQKDWSIIELPKPEKQNKHGTFSKFLNSLEEAPY